MGSLANALQILAQLELGRPTLAVSELAARLGLPKSTVSRTLKELAEAGFVERQAGGRGYEPGYELFRLGSLYKSQHLPVDRIDQRLTLLAGEFPATGYVAVLHGPDAVMLRVREGMHPMRFIQREGASIPAFVTAIGKALLARLSDAELLRLLPEELVHEPLGYRASRDEVLAELELYRRRGWAELRDPAYRGIDAVAVALRPKGREVIACALCYMQAIVGAAEVARMVQALVGLARELAPTLDDPYWMDPARGTAGAHAVADGSDRPTGLFPSHMAD